MRRCSRVLYGLWARAKNEHSTPREIGCSVALGVLAGCTPLLGLHMWIALGLATLCRLNRVWAFIGSRISFTPIFALITFCEIETSHRLRFGTWASLSPHDAVDHGKELLGDWLLGTAIVGGALAATMGFVGYLLARRLQRSSTSDRGLPPSAALPEQSSESPR